MIIDGFTRADVGKSAAMLLNLRRRLVLLGLAALVGLFWQPAAAGQPPDAVGGGGYRGYLAVRPGPGGALEVLDARNADRLFVPASVLKVVTVAAALAHLGPEYRWVTRLTSAAAVAGATLDGDLVIEAGADPTWGGFFAGGAAEPLAALAGQVRAHGIERITGDLVVDAGRFPGRPHPVDRAFDDLPYRHGTPPAALAVDEATITVRVGPGAEVGAPARVRAPAGVEPINRTTTVGRDRHGAGTLDFIPLWGTDTLLLRGEYPISEAPAVVAASDPSPARRAAQRLRDALLAAGVVVEGGVRLGTRAAPASDPGALLAELRSPPLAALLDHVLTDSHNWYADTLALTLGLEVAGSGRFADGVDVIADFAAEQSTGARPARAGAWLMDGSGLSPANLLTPAAVVRVLADAAGEPWGRALIAALPRPGEGTLAAWPAAGPVAAKTGTLRHTVALAGLLDPESDAPVLFCYFVNHHPRDRAAARREIAAALRRWREG